VNRAVGGAYSSNHLTGCAVDIRCAGVEQAIRYAAILIDTADDTKEEYDELLIERNRKGHYWVHFAVKPKDNRRKTMFIQA
jgi:predicted aspartyl protease